MFDIVPLTIVIDYLKDDVGEKMEMFMTCTCSALHPLWDSTASLLCTTGVGSLYSWWLMRSSTSFCYTTKRHMLVTTWITRSLTWYVRNVSCVCDWLTRLACRQDNPDGLCRFCTGGSTGRSCFCLSLIVFRELGSKAVLCACLTPRQVKVHL